MTIETTSEPTLSLEGKLLVATPYIDQPPYRHAVVLMMQHTNRGSCGLVLENNLEESLARLEAASHPELKSNRLAQAPAGETDPAGLQLFAGCILWPAGHLERELETGIWMMTNARLNALHVTNDLWLSLLSKIGRSVLEETLNIKDFPRDATLN